METISQTQYQRLDVRIGFEVQLDDEFLTKLPGQINEQNC